MNEKEKHDRAVVEIANELFNFPDGQVAPGVFHPSWATYTNVPKQQMPVYHQFEGPIYPDIIIVDTAKSNLPRLIAEVETAERLTLEKSIQAKWKSDIMVCGNFYLFVPEGCALHTAEMLLNYKICFPTAMFTYGFDARNRLRLTPV